MNRFTGEIISLPPQPPMMSFADITYKAWGIIGPIIFFRSAHTTNPDPALVTLKNDKGR